jgi:hypothetical protein
MTAVVALASFDRLTEFVRTAQYYRALRHRYPHVAARHVHSYLRDGDGAGTLEQYVCSITAGHEWAYTGTAYGGDEDTYHGEGRCYCALCGADGDA